MKQKKKEKALGVHSSVGSGAAGNVAIASAGDAPPDTMIFGPASSGAPASAGPQAELSQTGGLEPLAHHQPLEVAAHSQQHQHPAAHQLNPHAHQQHQLRTS